MTHKYAELDDTVYFWFAANNTSGSGDDGSSPAAHVREAGATGSAAPVLSPTPTLLSHASFPAGCYEVAVAATAGNGFEVGKTYAVFCTIAVDAQNPTGFVGSFTLAPVLANVEQIDGSPTAAANLALSARTMITAMVQANSTTTLIKTDLTETEDNQYVGRVAIFVDPAALHGQAAMIEAYSGSTKELTVSALTSAPADGDIIIIV